MDVEPPPAGCWSLEQVTPGRGGGPDDLRRGRRRRGVGDARPREGIELVLLIEGDHGSYGAQVSTAEYDRSDDGGAAKRRRGDRAARASGCAPTPRTRRGRSQAFKALVEHARTSLFELDHALLEADRDGTPRRPETLAGLARARRWLDEIEGDGDGEPLADYDAVPYWATGWEGIGWTFAQAIREHDPGLLASARMECAARIRNERLPPSRSTPRLARGDGAHQRALTGHRCPITARCSSARGSGAGPRRRRAAAPGTRIGRRTLGGATLELTRCGKLIASFEAGLVLELHHNVARLYRGEELLELREGQRTHAESLAVAQELLRPADFALLQLLLDGAEARSPPSTSAT